MSAQFFKSFTKPNNLFWSFLYIAGCVVWALVYICGWISWCFLFEGDFSYWQSIFNFGSMTAFVVSIYNFCESRMKPRVFLSGEYISKNLRVGESTDAIALDLVSNSPKPLSVIDVCVRAKDPQLQESLYEEIVYPALQKVKGKRFLKAEVISVTLGEVNKEGHCLLDQIDSIAVRVSSGHLYRLNKEKLSAIFSKRKRLLSEPF